MSIILFTSQQGSNTSSIVESFVYDPPSVDSAWLQKTSVSDEILMEIKYSYHSPIPSVIELPLFEVDRKTVKLYDNGTNGDRNAGDNIYTTKLDFEISNFIDQINALNTSLSTQSNFVIYDGHDAEVDTNFIPFDIVRFNNGEQVFFDLKIIQAAQCESEILKQNSLFITDLAVVEDLARNYNPCADVGNVQGLYTFGTFIRGLCNTSLTGMTPKEFLKNWISYYAEDQTFSLSTPYGPNRPVTVAKRERTMNLIIRPWIAKANGVSQQNYSSYISTGPTGTTGIHENNWKALWDATPEDSLLKYAPFRMMAIVNRLDLRGNMAYGTNALNGTQFNKNTGETRFIFTLISLYDHSDGSGFTMRPGDPPLTHGIEFGNKNNAEAIDWRGMNLIFEYQNLDMNSCELQDFAQAWLDLSSYTLGSSGYKDALDSLVSPIILGGSISSSVNNGSTLGRLRSNEKVLFPASTNVDSTWPAANWQFRQFEINSVSHQLDMVPLNNTVDARHQWDSTHDSYHGHNLVDNLGLVGKKYNTGKPIVDLFYTPVMKSQILKERHRLTDTKLGEYKRYLSRAAEISQEHYTYFDFDYRVSGLFYDKSVEEYSGNKNAKKLRHKFSINTCTGCHSGETKVPFAQMLPTGYGESANYWDSFPDTKTGAIDTRFGDRNKGKTLHNGYQIHNNNPVGNHAFNNSTLPIVSAFITGRFYGHSQNPINNNWLYNSFQDDNIDDDTIDHILSYDTIRNFYYVNDPSNSINDPTKSYFGRDYTQFAYNELDRRKLDLCNFLKSDCAATFDPLSIIAHLVFSPIVE